MKNFYIFTDGNVRGPFPPETVAMMLADGRIDMQTLLCSGKGQPWIKAADVGVVIEELEKIKNTAQAPKPTQVLYPTNANHPAAGNPPSPESVAESANTAASTQSRREVVFYCPHCSQKYSGSESWLGRDINCTRCSKSFTAIENAPTKADRTPSQSSTVQAAQSVPNANSTENKVSSATSAGKNSMEFFDWENSTGELICPHCWVKFNSDQLLYIASHPALTGDPVLGSMAQKRFLPTIFNARGQALDEMSQATNDLACPRCHLKIPATIIDEKSCYFSLVGASGTGKSYYLATLLNQVRKNMSSDFACTLLDVDPEMNALLDGYEETLFRSTRRSEVAVLPKTQAAGGGHVTQVTLNNISVNLPKPFIYELKHFISNQTIKDCNIVFYDNSGELFMPGADNLANPGTRHLACSDGIIFLFDPLNDAVMRTQCAQEEPQLQSDKFVYDQLKLLSEMISRIRRHRNLNVEEKCQIPLVIGVCKHDAWQHLLERDISQLPVRQSCEGELAMQWVQNTIMDVSFELRELLFKYAPALVNTAESFFEKVIFIPFSNFGCFSSPADADGGLGVIPEKINPLWVTEPLMALLAENSLIAKAPLPEGNIPPANAQIAEDFIILKHPENGRLIRLPWNYSGVVITVNGKQYKLPHHPRSNQQIQDKVTMLGKMNNDLWN